MSGWRWISIDVALAIHERQLAEHGGLSGLPNKGAVEAALGRPKHLASYGNPDAAALAAAFAWGVIHNHGFADGNKRTAWVIARLFLSDNGCHLQFDKADAVNIMLAVAAGETNEENLAQWFRDRL